MTLRKYELTVHYTFSRSKLLFKYAYLLEPVHIMLPLYKESVITGLICPKRDSFLILGKADINNLFKTGDIDLVDVSDF